MASGHKNHYSHELDKIVYTGPTRDENSHNSSIDLGGAHETLFLCEEFGQ